MSRPYDDSQPDDTSALTYKAAGVDIDKADRLVSAIKPHAARTSRPGSNPDLGGFGGLFDLKAAGFTDPVLVAATDGVGTKLELARKVGIHRGLGIDLVAMCANDLLAQGAEPLFFLDYFATGVLDSDIAADVIAGIADGCVDAGCALIGGETAEMPGLYPKGEYDLAGFCVGAAERDRLLSVDLPQNGDQLICIASDGVHANGFSLVRKIIETQNADLKAPAPFDSSRPLGEILITPTRIYSRAVKAAGAAGTITGIAHITGGGLIENPPRVYSDKLALEMDMTSYELPALFRWLKAAARLSDYELARTFNCGIGLMIFVRPQDTDNVLNALEEAGETAWRAGELVDRGDASVCLHHIEEAWA